MKTIRTNEESWSSNSMEVSKRSFSATGNTTIDLFQILFGRVKTTHDGGNYKGKILENMPYSLILTAWVVLQILIHSNESTLTLHCGPHKAYQCILSVFISLFQERGRRLYAYSYLATNIMDSCWIILCPISHGSM